MFLQNMLKVLAGNLTGLILTFLTMPLITRAFSPEEYGTLSAFNSVVLAATPLTTLGFEKALLISKGDEVSRSLLWIAFLSVILWGALCQFVGWTNMGVLMDLFNIKYGADYLMSFITVGIVIAGWHRILIYWAIRDGKFGAQGTSRVAGVILDKSTAIIGGWAYGGPIWLLSGRIIGFTWAIIILTIGLRKSVFFSRIGVYRQTMSYALKRYARFSLSALAAFINGAAREFPVLILSMLFNPAVAGTYGFARQVVGLPLVQLGDAISSAFYHSSGEGERSGQDYTDVSMNMLRFQLIFIFPAMTILAIFIRPVVPFMFGTKWMAAGPITQALALSFAFSFCYRSISTLFDIKEKQTERLVFNIILIIFSLSALYIGFTLSNENIAVLLYSCTNAVLYFICILYLMRIAGCSQMKTITIFIQSSLPLAAFIPAVYFGHYNRYLYSFILMIFGLVIYYIIILRVSFPDIPRVLMSLKQKRKADSIV